MAQDDSGAETRWDGADWGADPLVLAALFSCLPIGLYLTDHAGRINAVNSRAVELLGRPAAALRGADAHALLHRALDGSPLPKGTCRLLAVIEEGGVERGCATFLQGDGRPVVVDWASAQIRQNGRVIGAVVLFEEATERVAAERRQAGYLATLESLTERMTLLAEITTVLTQTLDVDETLRRLGRLVVPRLADWAAVDLLAGDEQVRRAAVATPEDLMTQATGWTGVLPPVPESSRSVLAKVLRGGEPVLLSPEDIAASPDSPLAAAQHDLFKSLGAVSAIVAPLRTGRQVLGALTVARTDPAHPFDAAEAALIADIARRAALAVDNARMFSQQRDIATAWQGYLLAPLPRVEGLELAARYLPAPEGSQVGGDWYDALVLADGATALVIGDISGHDLGAAVGMAQLRSMLRVLLWNCAGPPSVIVNWLDRATAVTSEATMATMVLCRIAGAKGGTRQLLFTNAGHPPPLLITPNGRARYLDQPHDMLVGTRLPAAEQRRDSVEPLPAGSTLLLYTDGLVEAPGNDLDTGLTRLRRNAVALARHPLEEFCDGLLKRLPPGHSDDIAMLAVRLPPV